MEPNNYNSIHILSEAVIMGGISMYFYKKISELESTIEVLKSQSEMQNNQIRYLLSGGRSTQPPLNYNCGGNSSVNTTPLRIPQPQLQKESFSNHREQYIPPEQPNMECEGGVCRSVPKPPKELAHLSVEKEDVEKKVSISKISKQIEFNRENMELDQTSKINTFTNFSPNPIIKSVTPKPSINESIGGDSGNELEKILNDIDNE
jgi:hypothetical protein